MPTRRRLPRTHRIMLLAGFAGVLVGSIAAPAVGAAAPVAATISGRALNYAAAPLEGIRVAFCTAPSACNVTTTTGADGRFVSPGLSVGDYRVRFTDPGKIYAAGYATSATGNTTDRWSAAQVIHLASNRTGIVGNLLPGTGIYGVITGPTGGPLADASVTACGVPDEICGTGRSDARGRYRVVVGEGLFKVRVRATASGESFDGYIGSFGLTFSSQRAVRLLGQPGMVHGASVQLTRAPRASFVVGTQLSSAGDSPTIATRIAWAASADPATSYTLRERVDLGPTRSVASVTGATFSGSLSVPLTIGHGYRFDVRPTTTTSSGPVVGQRSSGPAFDLLSYQESSSKIVYGGAWASIAGPTRSGGHATVSRSTGAAATFTFTGRAVAWVGRTGPGQGTAQVFIDDQFAATIDLSAQMAALRTLVFARSWPAAGEHVVEIRESSILTHPPVEIDAFLVMD